MENDQLDPSLNDDGQNEITNNGGLSELNLSKEKFASRHDFTPILEKLNLIKNEIQKVIVGQEKMIELLLASILAGGHVLIEGAPGLAKTLTAKLLSKAINVDFKRIQFTPDLMPSDILGTTIFNFKTSEFDFKQGPLFSNLILIDEINRSPAKTQAALFEVMEERQITIEGKRYPMQQPYMIVATQNPIDMEGTYQLPEAQMDRFLFRIRVNYPSLDEEIIILKHAHALKLNDQVEEVNAVLSAEDIVGFQLKLKDIHVEEHLFDYIAHIVQLTRSHPDIDLGSSPRGSLAILNGAKAMGLLRGRDFITPDDILDVAPAVLSHRLVLTAEKEMEGGTTEEVVREMLRQIEVPK